MSAPRQPSWARDHIRLIHALELPVPNPCSAAPQRSDHPTYGSPTKQSRLDSICRYASTRSTSRRAVSSTGAPAELSLEARGDLSVDGLELNAASLGAIGLEVYMIPGSYGGSTGNPGGAGWTRVATDDGQAVGQGMGQAMPVNFATPPLTLPGRELPLIPRCGMDGFATRERAWERGTARLFPIALGCPPRYSLTEVPPWRRMT